MNGFGGEKITRLSSTPRWITMRRMNGKEGFIPDQDLFWHSTPVRFLRADSDTTAQVVRLDGQTTIEKVLLSSLSVEERYPWVINDRDVELDEGGVTQQEKVTQSTDFDEDWRDHLPGEDAEYSKPWEPDPNYQDAPEEGRS